MRRPCPSGGLPPFRPGLVAGTMSNAASRFSPFNVRLFRADSEQEIAFAAAKARTGPHGGQEELDSPSCPAASQIGRTLAGSGAGSALHSSQVDIALDGRLDSATHRAEASFKGQNGKVHELKPEMVAVGCAKKGKGRSAKGRKGAR